MTDMVARALAATALNSSDVKQFESNLNFPTIGESGVLYLDTSVPKLYYWDGATMAYLSIGGTGSVDKQETEAVAIAAVDKVAEEKVQTVLNEAVLDGGTSV